MLLLIESVGIEIELENIRRRDFQSMFGYENVTFHTTSDASCESILPTHDRIPIVGDIRNVAYSNRTYGLELVSNIIDTSMPYLDSLKKMTSDLISMGESPRSYRAGFHVHINTPINLKVLKSICRLGRNLEQVFFLLGCMGYDYRGFRNDSTYCRPITKWGPVCVPTKDDKYAQVFNSLDLIRSKSIQEFKTKYGDHLNITGRYIPLRYHWLNLTTLFSQGSLEFRIFNKSLDPTILYAIIEFCKSFSLYAIESSFKESQADGMMGINSVFDVDIHDKEKIIEKFEAFVDVSNLKEKQDVVETLYFLLSSGEIESIILPKTYVFSHLQFHALGNRVRTHWPKRKDYPTTFVDEGLIKRPNFVDRHNLNSNPNPIPNLNSDSGRELHLSSAPDLVASSGSGRDTNLILNSSQISRVSEILEVARNTISNSDNANEDDGYLEDINEDINEDENENEDVAEDNNIPTPPIMGHMDHTGRNAPIPNWWRAGSSRSPESQSVPEPEA